MKNRFYLCTALATFVAICLVISLNSGKKEENKPTSVITPTDLATTTDATPTDTSSESNSSESNSSDVSSSNSSDSSATSSVDSCNHKFKAATCTKAKYCTVCKKSYGKPLGHKWKEATCKTLKTCKVCKLAVGVKGDHTYKNGYCSLCNAKDPNFGSLTSHEWQCFKSDRLITFDFKNAVLNESEMVDMSKISDSGNLEFVSENIVTIGNKEWYAVNGQGLDLIYTEKGNTITIIISDQDNPEENGKKIVLTRIGKTKLKVTKCGLKGKYWKIRVGDVLTAVAG